MGYPVAIDGLSSDCPSKNPRTLSYHLQYLRDPRQIAERERLQQARVLYRMQLEQAEQQIRQQEGTLLDCDHDIDDPR